MMMESQSNEGSALVTKKSEEKSKLHTSRQANKGGKENNTREGMRSNPPTAKKPRHTGEN